MTTDPVEQIDAMIQTAIRDTKAAPNGYEYAFIFGRPFRLRRDKRQRRRARRKQKAFMRGHEIDKATRPP